MNRRRVLAWVALAALVLAAGCLGGDTLDEERLNEDATYDWETEANATVNITGTEYHAVYDVPNGTSLAVYQLDDLGTEQPVAVGALKFRYPNGTVVGASQLDVERTDARTVVTPPAAGQLAYTATTRPKSFHTPVLVEGSYEVVLPENMRIDAFLLGTISPDGYATEVASDDRVHLRWAESPADEIRLRYYLVRDMYLFVGLVGGLIVLAGGGVVYFTARIRELERRREESGLDLSDDGAP